MARRVVCKPQFFRELADVVGMLKALQILRENPRALREYADIILRVACEVVKHVELCELAECLDDLARDYDALIREHTHCLPYARECKPDWLAVERDERFRDLLKRVQEVVDKILALTPEAIIMWASDACSVEDS